MPQATIFDLIQPAFFRLILAKPFATLETVEQFSIDLGTVAHGPPEQDQFIIVCFYLGGNMGNQMTGIDAGIDKMQRTSHLLGFAIVTALRAASSLVILGVAL